MKLEERYITPAISKKDYADQNLCFQLPDTPTQQVEPNVIYRDGKQIKFLLLPKAISFGAYSKALDALQAADWQKGSRAGNGQVLFGKKLTAGWIKPKAYRTNYKNMIAKPTLDQPRVVAALFPLVREMNKLVYDQLPEYYMYAQDPALNMLKPDGEEYDVSTAANPESAKGMAATLDVWGNFTYTIRGTIFSTLELNRNIVFKAHEDGSNVDGTCVCIAALGEFVGGRLVFPRYGYSAELDPYDLLICDNNRELHGNLGPIVGERFSVVAFQHDSLLGRAPAEDLLEGHGDPGESDAYAAEVYEAEKHVSTIYDPDDPDDPFLTMLEE